MQFDPEVHHLVPAEPGWRAQIVIWDIEVEDFPGVHRVADGYVIHEFTVPVSFWACDRLTATVTPASYRRESDFGASLVPSWQAGHEDIPTGAQSDYLLRAPGDPEIEFFKVLMLERKSKRAPARAQLRR